MQNLPLFCDLPSSRKGSVKIIIEGLLMNPKVEAKIRPYFTSEVCGHKVMDLKGAVDVLHAADSEDKLKPYALNDFQLGNSLKNVLRSRYQLDKRWKIVDVNPKVAAMMKGNGSNHDTEES